MTFEEALEKAKNLKPNIDACTEYENGYVFCFSGDAFQEGPSPVVILKKDGRAVMYTYFIFEVGKGKKIREFKL